MDLPKRRGSSTEQEQVKDSPAARLISTKFRPVTFSLPRKWGRVARHRRTPLPQPPDCRPVTEPRYRPPHVDRANPPVSLSSEFRFLQRSVPVRKERKRKSRRCSL